MNAHALWKLIRPPRGRSTRRALGMLSAALAVTYVFLIVYPPIPAPYIRQHNYMPLWMYGTVFAMCALALYVTENSRASAVGRLVATGAFTFYIFFATTFYPSAPSALLTYCLFAYTALGEASFVSSED